MRGGRRKRERMRSIRMVGPCAVALHMVLRARVMSRRYYRTLLRRQRTNPRARADLWARWVSQDAADIRRYRTIIRDRQAIEHFRQIIQK